MSGPKTRVLVVLGYQDLRDLVGRVLSRAGYLLCSAATCEGALLQVAICAPHLALVDNAVEGTLSATATLIRALIELEVPVLVLGGNSDRDRQLLFEAGARECLRKPFGANDLLAAVQRALEIPGATT